MKLEPPYTYMFKVGVLAPQDFEFAVDLANTMDWNMAIEDFQFMASIESNGLFLLLDDDKRIGIATANSFGTKGWFGNLIIDNACRRQGAGTILLKHALGYLKAKGVKSTGLYAYPHLTTFYGKQGFKKDTEFSLLKIKNIPKITAESLPKITPEQSNKIMAFDQEYFEGDRTPLLRSIINTKGNACHFIKEKDEIVGYIAATVYDKLAWLGPLICKPQRYDVAIKLIKAVLTTINGKTAYAVASKSDETLKAAFLGFGFKEEFSVSRMFLGKAFPKNCIYTSESLERG